MEKCYVMKYCHGRVAARRKKQWGSTYGVPTTSKSLSTSRADYIAASRHMMESCHYSKELPAIQILPIQVAITWLVIVMVLLSAMMLIS